MGLLFPLIVSLLAKNYLAQSNDGRWDRWSRSVKAKAELSGWCLIRRKNASFAVRNEVRCLRTWVKTVGQTPLCTWRCDGKATSSWRWGMTMSSATPRYNFLCRVDPIRVVDEWKQLLTNVDIACFSGEGDQTRVLTGPQLGGLSTTLSSTLPLE